MTERLPFHFSLSCIGEGNGNPFQYSCLENPVDGRAWKAAVHGVAKGRTWLSDFTFTFHFHALEKEMATHSSVLAWRIPGTGKPGGLPSMGSHRVRHDWRYLAAAAAVQGLHNVFDLPSWPNGGYFQRLPLGLSYCDRSYLTGQKHNVGVYSNHFVHNF